MLGLVIGSIYTVWPWRKSFTDDVTNEYKFLSIMVTIIGFTVIYSLEKISKK